MKIKYLKHKIIDFDAWDACIKNAHNSRIYGYSGYLNAVADTQWDALILDDYQAVMPLPFRKKFGLHYVYQPRFAQQLGVYSQEKINVTEFIKNIPKKFIKTSQNLNSSNNLQHIKTTEFTNFVLPLSDSYPNLYQNFDKNTRRNISKFHKTDIEILKHEDFEKAVNFKVRHAKHDFDENAGEILKNVFSFIQKKHKLFVYEALNTNKDSIAYVTFTEADNRIYYPMSEALSEAKENSVTFGIFNKIIKENAGFGKTLDFEGSNIEGIARFFKGFGAIEENYYRYEKSIF